MANGGGKSGGLKGFFITIATLMLVAAVVVSWARINNVKNVDGAYAYFKALSDKISSCNSDLHWTCKTPMGAGNNYGNSGNATDEGNGENGTATDSSSPSNSATVDANGVPIIPLKYDSILNPNSNKNAKDFEEALNKLTVAEPTKDKYNKKDWPHWSGVNCSVREEILSKYGKNVKVTDPTGNCIIEAGQWISPFDNQTINDPNKANVTYIITPEYATLHGGNSWSSDEKIKFANDGSYLNIIDGGEMAKKMSKGPGDYMPSNRSYQCSYSKLWISEATSYKLTITAKDKTALKNGLEKC